LLGIILILSSASSGQVETATISGVITDQFEAVIIGAEVLVTNADTNVTSKGTSNQSGVYLVTGLKPGRYRVHVAKEGFKGIDLTDLILNVQDSVSRNFTLQVGSQSETVSVDGSALQINTQDAAVSTVVDRQFAENLPMNGRSFQTLIQLTPGVVVVPSNGADGGQFSVNGQRAASNYWMVDGVSANIGVGSGNVPGNGFGGTLGSFSAQGGTNSLVSVEALQEFRIQTSTYAPEFGRTPGGQISIVTRSGTNQFHGTAFDYLRNDVLDANDWFVNYLQLAKPPERQNDFGGTFSGPIVKNRTFFFFSYEGLRLRLPQTAPTTVPCDSTCQVFGNARAMAASPMQPFLNAYPVPNGPEVFRPCAPNVNGCPSSGKQPTGSAQFNKSYSNAATLDAYSLRIDHKLMDRLTLFGRYNYSPSESDQRGPGPQTLSTLLSSRITTQTVTLGTTWTISPRIVNDLRFNYSRVNAASSESLDNFGGAVPLASLPLPSPYTSQNAQFALFIAGLMHGELLTGRNAQDLQRQINVVDTVSLTKGSHALKFGLDFRRLSPPFAPPLYLQQAVLGSVPAAEMGQRAQGVVQATAAATVLFRNFGSFVQDTWRIVPRAALTYGLRWDLDSAPSSLTGPNIVGVTGYNLNDFSQLGIAPAGTAPFKTTYGNVAPRIGLAYQLTQNQGWETVIRGGFGVFYDLVSSQVGPAVIGAGGPPFSAVKRFGPGGPGTFPLDPVSSAPPTIPSTGSISRLYAFNPNLKLPYTLEWNVALEQALGRQQTISASYVGASGRRLLQTSLVSGPPSNPSIQQAAFVDNKPSSGYNALQMQFQRRLSHGLQVLASYSWAHSIDDGSAGSAILASNAGVPGSGPNANRGPSDFDIRHTFSAGVTYDIPVRKTNAFTDSVLRGWSIESTILARSAPPADVSDSDFFIFNSGVEADIRPDVIPGQPFYLYGANCASVMQALFNLLPGQGCPGGKALNPNAFTDPPGAGGCNPGPPTFDFPCNPARQGNVPRNFLRGFGATQWDFAVHRDFAIRESAKLQFRAEMFNVLNHPNFGQPSGCFGFFCSSPFGLSSQTLGRYLDGGGLGSSNVGGGAFSSLYQVGGPRSIQLALKFFF